MKVDVFKSKNLYDEYTGQIDFDEKQITVFTNKAKDRNWWVRAIKKLISQPILAEVKSVTYWTIQHSYPKIAEQKEEWFFSNYDNIASAASALYQEDRFEFVYSTKYGATSFKQAKIGLKRVIEANKNDPRSGDPILRIVMVIKFFDLVYTE